jgi:DNA-binding NtrC family response regulator
VSDFRLRALLVEDDPLWSSTLHEQFTDWGFDAHLAATVREARALLDRDWAIVILDIGLPDGTGMTLAEDLAQRSTRPLTVAVTGTATVEEAFKLARLGVKGYLQKPVVVHDLRETIRVLLDDAARSATELESLAGAQVGTQSYQEVTARVRRAMVLQALQLAGGNKSGAARILQVSRQAVQQLIRSLEV